MVEGLGTGPYMVPASAGASAGAWASLGRYTGRYAGRFAGRRGCLSSDVPPRRDMTAGRQVR